MKCGVVGPVQISAAALWRTPLHLAAASGHLEVDFSRPSVTMTWTPSDDEHFHGDNIWESPDEPVDLGVFMVKIWALPIIFRTQTRAQPFGFHLLLLMFVHQRHTVVSPLLFWLLKYTSIFNLLNLFVGEIRFLLLKISMLVGTGDLLSLTHIHFLCCYPPVNQHSYGNPFVFLRNDLQ